MATENKENSSGDSQDVEKKEELSLEDRLKESDDKLLRSLAELENQRRRYAKAGWQL